MRKIGDMLQCLFKMSDDDLLSLNIDDLAIEQASTDRISLYSHRT